MTDTELVLSLLPRVALDSAVRKHHLREEIIHICVEE